MDEKRRAVYDRDLSAPERVDLGGTRRAVLPPEQMELLRLMRQGA